MLRKGFDLTTKDLVTITILSALGGVLSTYVGYLANLVNSFLGTPFGAGQFIAGLHVFWLLLARGATGKHGSGTLTGLLKGLVEMMIGSVHGVIVVIVSLVEGLIVDILLIRFKAGDRLGQIIAGGLATASNVFIFQLLFLSGVPVTYILVITLLAFASGVIFGGCFAHDVLVSMGDSGLLTWGDEKSVSRLKAVSGYILVGIFLVGSAWYYGAVYSWKDRGCFAVGGLVENPFNYRQSQFEGEVITVEAELSGSYTHIDPRNYTGILLASIIEAASPLPEASEVRLIAADGYTVVLDLDLIQRTRSIIIVTKRGKSSLVADELDGSLWVQGISAIELV